MELYFVQHGAAKTEAEHPRSELDRGGTRNRKSASQIRLRMFASSQCAPYSRRLLPAVLWGSCSTAGGRVLLSARFGAVAMREIGSKL